MTGEIFIPIVLFLVAGFVAWVIVKGNIARAEQRTAAQSAMLDKFSTSAEFTQFLQSPEGGRYMRSLTEAPRKSPREKILAGIRTGVVLAMVSIGVMLTSFLAGFSRPTQEPPFLIGFVGLFLGLGFLVSAWISHSMSKQWGLFEDHEAPRA